MLKPLTTDSKVLYFDLESDGLLDQLTKIHTICIGSNDQETVAAGPDEVSLRAALEALEHADYLVGHNIIGFDIPAIQKLHPGWSPKGKVLDTLTLAGLAYSNMSQIDWSRPPEGMPKNLYGRHKLEAWGHRLGLHKGEHKDWSQWSQKMEDYCKQDVEVTKALFKHLAECDLSEASIEVELELQKIISAQERHGFCFDLEGAQTLAATLSERRDELLKALQAAFPPIPAKCLGVYGGQKARMIRLLKEQGWEESDWANNMAWLQDAGIKFKWTKEQPFNPNSEKQIIARLKEMGWEPIEFTDKGQPKMDEPVLAEVGRMFPEAAPLVEFSMVEKRLSQIATGKGAWLKQVKDDGRMHGRANPLGTVTHRFAHSSPNMGQVPAVDKPYGPECRGFFFVPKGYRLVGCDVSGLELRLLSHYMCRWDRGAYAKTILEGDIHTQNQENAGLETRDQAKTFIYAFLYGAGDAKLGSIALPDERRQEILRKEGKKLKSRFMRKTPALAYLAKAVRQKVAKQKKLVGIDGRLIPIRSSHSALNALIQSAGSIATKRATVHFRDLMEAAGHRMEKDWCLVAHVHDEWQTEVREEIADETARIAVRAIEEAGEMLGLRCPITGKAKVGRNWAETH